MNHPPGADRPTATPPAVGRLGVPGHTVPTDGPNPAKVTGMTPTPVSGRTANRLGATFYVSVAAVALAGQALAAVDWLHWPLWLAVPAVAVLELGGIALAARADYRRRLGERAVWARALSAAVALFAVVFNWAGHADHLAGGFFAGMSALGYAVWLINAGDRRRDQLRAEGKLPPTPPAYEAWHWVRHPLVTARARSLAKANTTLGLYGSLDAAREEIATERRTKAIAKILRRRFEKGAAADLAVHTYDLDKIARGLADAADYTALTDLIAAELTPDKLATIRVEVPAELPPAADAPPSVDVPEPATGTSAPAAPEVPAPPRTGSSGRSRRGSSAGSSARNNGRKPTRKEPEPRPRRTTDETRKLALELLAEVPPPTQTAVAQQLGISDRRLRGVLNTPASGDDSEHAQVPINGHDLIGASA